MRIFTGNANRKLGQDVSDYLGIDLGRTEVGSFSDGETMVRILDDVRGADVFIIQPTTPPVNQHLMELLIMVDAIRRASAKRITAVIPYFGYARQDRKHAGRVPITAKLVANMLTAAGIDRILCMDLHAMQIQGFFDIPVDHLYARPALMNYLREKQIDRPVFMSPDLGSLKMADSYCRRLGGNLAVVEKRRVNDTEVEKGHVIGDVKGRNVIIVDDMISTAGSMEQAIYVAREHGAKSIMVMATHALFVPPAPERLQKAAPDEIIVTDTVPLREEMQGKVTQLTVSDLLGEAISRIHRNKSLSVLFA